jgi:AraC-like DNA-binding protein
MELYSYIPTKLTGIVDLIWEHKMTVPGNYTVLPSGKVEIIFPITPVRQLQAVKIAPNDNPVNNHSCFLSGLHTKPLKVTFDQFHTFGIQMKPVAVKALFGIPLCEIRDYFVEGSLVFDTVNMMEEKLQTCESFIHRAKWFESFLLTKINETPDLHIAINLDRMIRKFICQEHDGSGKSIQDLMGYSRTHTYRLFNDWFGLSVQSYQKLLQFIRATETLHNPSLKLTEVGLDIGYFDQSHFIRTFQEFAEMTPGGYRKQMTSIPGILFG